MRSARTTRSGQPRRAARSANRAVLCVSLMVVMLPRCGFGQTRDIRSLSYSLTSAASDTVKSTDSTKQLIESACKCHPSLPLEILASSLITGIPAYWGYRAFFDDTLGFAPQIGLIPISFFLYIVSLAPVAEWTSGCKANAWNSVWIGFGSQITCALLYDVAYGHSHILNLYKINWPEYFALGVVPTIITSFIYNLFLHPKPPKNGNGSGSDEGMYLMPSVNGGKSFALNFGMRF